MKSCGGEISDRRVAEKVLFSLPEKFDPIVAAIEETKDLFMLGVPKLKGSLWEEISEEKWKVSRDYFSIKALLVHKILYGWRI